MTSNEITIELPSGARATAAAGADPRSMWLAVYGAVTELYNENADTKKTAAEMIGGEYGIREGVPLRWTYEGATGTAEFWDLPRKLTLAVFPGCGF